MEEEQQLMSRSEEKWFTYETKGEKTVIPQNQNLLFQKIIHKQQSQWNMVCAECHAAVLEIPYVTHTAYTPPWLCQYSFNFCF